jgi:hypothetical protein
VSALLPERGVRYRAALQFDRQLTPPRPWGEEDRGFDPGGRGQEASRRGVTAAGAAG